MIFRINLRSVPALLAAVIAFPAWSQSHEAAKKHVVVEFDIRDLAGAEGRAASSQARTRLLLEKRRANIASFLAASEAASPSTRIVLNRHGLPKLFLRDGKPLSSPSMQGTEEIAKKFLQAHAQLIPFDSSELDRLRLTLKDAGTDATFLTFTQTLDSVEVFNGQIKFTLSQAGEVMQVAVGDVIPELTLSTQARLSPLAAIRAAYISIGAEPPPELEPVANPNGRMAFANPRGNRFSPVSAEPSIFPLDAATARLAYRIFLEADVESWYEILIDAENGDLLFRHNLYVNAASGRVWTQTPMQGGRQLVPFPNAWLPATGMVTTGNNADAYLDANGDDKPDGVGVLDMVNGRPFSQSQLFDYPAGDGFASLDPRSYNAAAITNLFYFLNTAHDYYYSLGFTEQVGNFQTDNLGKGGLGNDAVLGEAHHPDVVDNAEFAPTPEGISPKIRMGLFTRGTTNLADDLDSAYDGQVVIHEYGHGVSNRLVGAGTSTSCLSRIQSGAMGEGWSDYFSNSYYNNPVQGAYLSQNTASGIRRQSYEGYTFTYEDIGNGESGYDVHDDGEIWGATLWDLRKTLGQAVADKLVMNGLKSTPCNPSMTDARDAILSADLAANGGNRASIWQVFARHGLGYSAAGEEGTLLTGTVYTAASDQPPDLQPAKNPAITSKPLTLVSGMGEAYTYAITASNPNRGVLTFALTSGPPGMTVDAVTGMTRWVAGPTGQRVKITVTDGRGGKVVHGFLVPVVTTLREGTIVTLGGNKKSKAFSTLTVPGNAAVLQVKLRGGSGDADLSVVGPSGPPSLSLRLGNNESLSFATPAAGRWLIEVDGFETYAGVSLTAATVTPAALSSRVTVNGLSGVIGDETFYRVTIPAGATTFVVSTSGGTGDVDLFVRKDKPAVCQSSLLVISDCLFDKSSDGDGNTEAISISNPAAGDWYIDVIGFDNYSGVTLTTLLTAPPALLLTAARMSFDAVEAGPAPPPQTLALSNPGATPYSWTARASSTGGAWLQVSALSGSGDATLTVTVNPAGLKAGSYQGAIEVTAIGLAGSPQSLTVTLNVAAPPASGPGSISILSGADQSGEPGTILTSPLVVQVNDTTGNPAANVSVTFTGTNANVNPATARSDASGRASTSVTLGPRTGAATVTAIVAGLSPVTFLATVTPLGPPTISGILDTAGLQPVVSPGSWFVVRGSSFSALTRGWTDADFNGAGLPKSLDGAGITVDGADASIYFISPSEIRAIAPAAVRLGPVDVVVTNSQGLSTTGEVVLAPLAPALFPLVAEDRKYAVALHDDGTLAAKTGLVSQIASRPIAAGEKLLLLGTGFGLTDPPVPLDRMLDGYPPLAMSDRLKIRVGELEAPISLSVMLGNGFPDLKEVVPGWPDGDRGLPGLYAISITVPDLPRGDYPLAIEFAGAVSTQTVFLSIGQVDPTPAPAGIR